MERLFEPVRYIKGVGPQREKQLIRLGIKDVYDLLWHLPRSYIDRNTTQKISELEINQNTAIRGEIRSIRISRTRRGMSILKALIMDDSAGIVAVWFNQDFLKNVLKPGQSIYIRGKVTSNMGAREISVSEYDLLDADEDNEGLGIIPVYPSTAGLSQKVWRTMMKNALEMHVSGYQTVVPLNLMQKFNLMPTGTALSMIHFPPGWEEQEQARRSLALEELFLIQLVVAGEKAMLESSDVLGYQHKEKSDLVVRVKNSLGFSLTGAQERVLAEIFADMEKEKPMNRLVQGDVGSGKTAVAALAMAKAVSSGYQVAFMAPTEILASQHFENLKKYYGDNLTIQLITGKTPARLKDSIIQGVISGEIDILVGTHALIQESVVFKHLSLAVIDEQHRFGVRQRALLGKKGRYPDVLVMTATPIPRTLTLTVYGDLEISTIDQLPPGRKEIKTLFIRQSARDKAYRFMLEQVEKGGQAYVVCPLIEESEKQDLINATELVKYLQSGVMKSYKVGLLHGRMKSEEKDKVMNDFKQGQIHVLVSTTVIEVGVDVPRATLMIIEQAERFGLSQLHQLRGRVGRGGIQSYCILVGNPATREAWQRLKALERTNDGFEIAEEDLRLRGPGDLWGVKQHGLPDLKAANLWKDIDLLQAARDEAVQLLKNRQPDRLLHQLVRKKYASQPEIASN